MFKYLRLLCNLQHACNSLQHRRAKKIAPFHSFWVTALSNPFNPPAKWRALNTGKSGAVLHCTDSRMLFQSKTWRTCKKAWKPWGEGTRSTRASAWLPHPASTDGDLFTVVLLVPRAGGGFSVKFSALGKRVSLQKLLLNLGCTEKHTYVLHGHLKKNLYECPVSHLRSYTTQTIHKVSYQMTLLWCNQHEKHFIKSETLLTPAPQSSDQKSSNAMKMEDERLFVLLTTTTYATEWHRNSHMAKRKWIKATRSIWKMAHAMPSPRTWIPNDIPQHHSSYIFI